MSYRAGLGLRLAAALRTDAGEARITCDECGLVTSVAWASGLPFTWFLAGKPPPRWKRVEREGKQLDVCPHCQAKPAEAVT